MTPACRVWSSHCRGALDRIGQVALPVSFWQIAVCKQDGLGDALAPIGFGENDRTEQPRSGLPSVDRAPLVCDTKRFLRPLKTAIKHHPGKGVSIRTTPATAEQPLLFTPGPVPIPGHLLSLGSRQPPYCRTPEFSQLTFEILAGLGYVFQTTGPVMILAGSGTAAMETVVLNFLDQTDRAVVVNAGTFGQRWCDLCDIHGIAYQALPVEPGADLDLDTLADALARDVSVLCVTAHETSTGALFDIEAIGRVAREHGVLLVVDAISSVCADRFQMDDWHVDVAVLSSQKGLALPPGLAFVAMSEDARQRLEGHRPRTLYFDVREYLANHERGQLPFTPPTGLFLQLHQRLRDIQEITLERLIQTHRDKAEAFRQSLASLPFGTLPNHQSQAITAVTCSDFDAHAIVQTLRTRYAIEVAPNGGTLKSKVFRVSHMGEHRPQDQQSLTQALEEICSRRCLDRPSANQGETLCARSSWQQESDRGSVS